MATPSEDTDLPGKEARDVEAEALVQDDPGPDALDPAGLGPRQPGPPEPADSALATSGGRAIEPALRSLSLPARLEAILYLKGRPLALGELAELAGLEREEAELALITLMADYAHRDTALEIHQEGNHYSLQLRQGLADLVQNLLPVDLSTASLRTLATIALKKRILQSDLVELRGSGAYDHIKELLAQNFIERRRQSEGRSYWLSLTEKFHRTFAVKEALGRARSGLPKGEASAQQLELDAEPAGEPAGEAAGEPAGKAADESADGAGGAAAEATETRLAA